MSKNDATWHVRSDDPEIVKAWQRPFDEEPAEEETMATPKKKDLTGGPGTSGFTTRIGRLNKLYHNLTPEQRANHPGFQRLYAVIQLEQELNDKMKVGAMGGVQQPEEAAPAPEPAAPGPNVADPHEASPSTSHDKAFQEGQSGITRPLNDFIKNMPLGGGE